jgi:glycosyltransferase-like protein
LENLSSSAVRVALLTYSTKPRGGVVHTLALAESLAARGEDVTVWTLGRGGDAAFFRRVDPSVKVRVVPFAPDESETVGERIVRSIATLRAAFEPDLYDIVHAEDCISANAVDHCIRTIHHLDSFTTPELVSCHERAIVEPIARICVSEAVAAEVRAGWGLNPTVIPNGVDAHRFAAAASSDPAARAAREEWQRELGAYVLAVGGIEPRKGTIDLLEAYAILRQTHPEIALVLAGGETLFDYRDYRAAFEQRARQLGVEYRLVGVVDDDRLPALVAASEVLAFVSTKEGFGMVAMEALAAGVPVVARELPVLREIFGTTVDFASDVPSIAAALSRALADEEPRTAGRMLAAEYSWAAAADAHANLYRSILGWH